MENFIKMKLTEDGNLDIDLKELNKLMDKYYKKYKPITPSEFALLEAHICTEIRINFAWKDVKYRTLQKKGKWLI